MLSCSDASVLPDGSALDATLDATFDAAHDRAADAAESGCPQQMALVMVPDAGAACVDLWEGALRVEEPDGGLAIWPYFQPVDAIEAGVRAAPAAGEFPQGYISQVQATAACKRSGKRLCTLAEWTAACRGQPAHDYLYPYGDAYDPSACNEGRASPIVRLFPNPTYSYQELNDPRCDQLDGGLARGGDFPKCVGAYGAFDMHGNLHEWIDYSPSATDPTRGSFMGGFFVDAKLNGPGCTYRTTAHAKTYHDYSTGFRCCSTP